MNDRRVTDRPRVRVVVLNYDGGEMTLHCLDALRRLDYPRTASRSSSSTTAPSTASPIGSVTTTPTSCCWSRWPTSASPVAATSGSATPASAPTTTSRWSTTTPSRSRAGCRRWSTRWRPTQAWARRRPRSCSLIATGAMRIDAPVTAQHGVRLSGLEVDGAPAWGEAKFDEGFWGPEQALPGEPGVRWTHRPAEVRVEAGPGPTQAHRRTPLGRLAPQRPSDDRRPDDPRRRRARAGVVHARPAR